jgi:hypothetical protein
MGVWPDGYYISYNIFNNAQTFAGSKICAFDRTKMLAGDPTATQQCFQLSTSYGGLLPSDLDGVTAPPAGSPNFFVNFGANSLDLKKNQITSVRWYEIRSPNGTPRVYQQGTLGTGDGIHRWMGSIAMDKQGNIALGYSASSSSVKPGIRYTGRLATDALGTMQTENIIQAGGGSQTGTLHRWGDYSAMTVDPVDDCTFWYTNEYLRANGSFNWSTRIASFKFPGCQ